MKFHSSRLPNCSTLLESYRYSGMTENYDVRVTIPSSLRATYTSCIQLLTRPHSIANFYLKARFAWTKLATQICPKPVLKLTVFAAGPSPHTLKVRGESDVSWSPTTSSEYRCGILLNIEQDIILLELSDSEVRASVNNSAELAVKFRHAITAKTAVSGFGFGQATNQDDSKWI